MRSIRRGGGVGRLPLLPIHLSACHLVAASSVSFAVEINISKNKMTCVGLCGWRRGAGRAARPAVVFGGCGRGAGLVIEGSDGWPCWMRARLPKRASATVRAYTHTQGTYCPRSRQPRLCQTGSTQPPQLAAPGRAPRLAGPPITPTPITPRPGLRALASQTRQAFTHRSPPPAECSTNPISTTQYK